MSRRLLLLALLLCGCCPNRLALVDWCEPKLRTAPGVQVATNNKDPKVLQFVVAQYQVFLESLKQTALAELSEGSPQVKIFVFATDEEYEKYREPLGLSYSTEAFYSVKARALFLPPFDFETTDEGERPYWHSLHHELVHHVHFSRWPTPPIMIAEGLAHWLSNGEFLSEEGLIRAALFDNKDGDFKQALAALDTVFVEPAKQDKTMVSRLWGYFLVRTLLTNPETSGSFVRYLKKQARRQDKLSDLARALGLTKQALARQVVESALAFRQSWLTDPDFLRYVRVLKSYSKQILIWTERMVASLENLEATGKIEPEEFEAPGEQSKLDLELRRLEQRWRPSWLVRPAADRTQSREANR